MPTTNWIWEASSDAYHEAMDPPPAPRKPTELECPFCDRVFVSEDPSDVSHDLGRHVAREHPLLRPVLVVAGKVLGPNATITRMPHPADIAIENATTIELAIDGAAPQPVSRAEAARAIAGSARRVLDLRLINERFEDGTAADVDYRIKVDVADELELEAIDQAFMRHLARDDVGRDDVLRFSNETDGVANFYRDGLASYLFGVFAKDTTSADPDALERALAAFGRAAFHLRDFGDRRVASAVAACARFNLNDLSGSHGRTGVEAVDLATRFLRNLSAAAEPPDWPARPSGSESDVRCPIDESTFGFLELFFSLKQARPNGWLGTELERVEHGTLTSPDRAKFAVVLGDWAARRNLPGVSDRCAAILYNDPIFGTAVNRWST